MYNKQVIVRIQKHVGLGKFKTIHKFYHLSSLGYEQYVVDEVKNVLKEGLFVYVKIGNQYSVCFDLEDLRDEYDAYYAEEKDTTIDDLLEKRLIGSNVMYYVERYLPKW